jgi:hypothetical protein
VHTIEVQFAVGELVAHQQPGYTGHRRLRVREIRISSDGTKYTLDIYGDGDKPLGEYGTIAEGNLQPAEAE